MALIDSPQSTGSCDHHVRFCLPSGSPIFQGHYPHHPLVPGMYLVDAAIQALVTAGTEQPLRRLIDLRMMQTVGPDEEVNIHLERVIADTETHVARWRCTLISNDKTVARFKLEFEARESECDAPTDTLDVGLNWNHISAHEITRLLAHRSPILLVDEAYVHPDRQSLVAHKTISLNEPCYAKIPSQSDKASLEYPDVLIVESFVQASGLLVAQREGFGDDVMVLGGLRVAEFYTSAQAGEALRHELHGIRRFGNAALVSGITRVGRRTVAVIHEVLIAARPAEALRLAPIAATAAPLTKFLSPRSHPVPTT